MKVVVVIRGFIIVCHSIFITFSVGGLLKEFHILGFSLLTYQAPLVTLCLSTMAASSRRRIVTTT